MFLTNRLVPFRFWVSDLRRGPKKSGKAAWSFGWPPTHLSTSSPVFWRCRICIRCDVETLKTQPESQDLFWIFLENPDPDPILFMEIHGTCWTLTFILTKKGDFQVSNRPSFSRNIPGEGFRAGWWLSGGVSISAPRRILGESSASLGTSLKVTFGDLGIAWNRFLKSKLELLTFWKPKQNHRNSTVCWLDMDMEALHFFGGVEWAVHPILWSSLVTCFTHLKQFSRCKMYVRCK